MQISPNMLTIDGQMFEAVPESDCLGCAFSTKYVYCAKARKEVPCASTKRSDRKNIIWIKQS